MFSKYAAILQENSHVISVKLLCNFIEVSFQHRCYLVDLLHVLRMPFPKNTSRRLLLLSLMWTIAVNFVNKNSWQASEITYFLYYCDEFLQECPSLTISMSNCYRKKRYEDEDSAVSWMQSKVCLFKKVGKEKTKQKVTRPQTNFSLVLILYSTLFPLLNNF